MWSRSLWETEGLKEVKRNMADYSDSITPYYTVWFLQVRCGNPHLVSSIWWDAIDGFFCSLKWHGWVEKRQRQANNNPKRSWKWTSCLSTLAGLSVVDMVYIFTYFVSKEDPNRGHIIHWTYVLNGLMRVFHLISYCPCSISEVCRRIQSCIVSVFFHENCPEIHPRAQETWCFPTCCKCHSFQVWVDTHYDESSINNCRRLPHPLVTQEAVATYHCKD